MIRTLTQIKDELADREAIRDCLYRYARAIDRSDADLLRTVYWPDAIDDHVLYIGNAYEFIDWCVPLLAQVEHSQHMLGNVQIDLDGDTARVETYYHAYERRRRASSEPYEMFVGGRYLDKFERRQGEWRILHRYVTWDWWRHFRDSMDVEKGVFGTGPVRMSGKFPDDPLYTLFR